MPSFLLLLQALLQGGKTNLIRPEVVVVFVHYNIMPLFMNWGVKVWGL